jgi:hypothetical protein
MSQYYDVIANEYNSRYLLYCKAHGNEGNPGRQLEEDSAKYPGGKMCGFMLWIQAKWRVFGDKNDVSIDYRTMYQKDFDTWLTSEVHQVEGGFKWKKE